MRLSRTLTLIPMQVEIPQRTLPTFPREMSCLPNVSPSRLFFFLELLYPFQRCSIQSLPSSLATSCHFYPSFFPSLSQVVHSFLGPLAPRSSYPFSRRTTLKLAFSLLSSKAADFPHFTFQSHGGCDFLPHFHSDNIEGVRRAVRVKRESKSDSSRTLSTVSPGNEGGMNGRAK